MSDYNLSKGEDLFFKEIKKICFSNLKFENKINFISSLFSGKVGIMQIGNPNEIIVKDQENSIFELNAIPSYKKLSYCILHAAVKCTSENDIDLVKFVIESYKNEDYKNYMKRDSINSEDIDSFSAKINEEIENNSRALQNLTLHNVLDIDEDGNSFSRLIEMDNIELIDDFENSDLTVEGLRTLGLIAHDHDSLDNKEFVLTNTRNTIPSGKIEFDTDGTPVITCPFTGSKNVYQIDSSTYASFETDQPFRVVFNLADVNPN